MCFEEVMPSMTMNEDIMRGMIPRPSIDIISDVVDEMRRIDFLRSAGIEPRSRILMYGRHYGLARVTAAFMAHSLGFPLYGLRFDRVVMRGDAAPAALSEDFGRLAAQPCIVLLDRVDAFLDASQPVFPRSYALMMLDILSRIPAHNVVLASADARWRLFDGPGVFQVHLPVESFTREERARLLRTMLRALVLGGDGDDDLLLLDPESIIIRATLQGPMDIHDFCLDVARRKILDRERPLADILADEAKRWRTIHGDPLGSVGS